LIIERDSLHQLGNNQLLQKMLFRNWAISLKLLLHPEFPNLPIGCFSDNASFNAKVDAFIHWGVTEFFW